MKKLLRPAIAAVAVLGVAAPFGVANSFGSYDYNSGYQYAVKYVCGCNTTSCPSAGDNLVNYGDYRTVINLVNANGRETVWSAVAVPTNNVGETGGVAPQTLLSFAGDTLDCSYIRQTLLGGPVGLIEGMVILRSCRRPIEVQTVYTAANADNSPTLVSTQVVTNDGSKVDDCYFPIVEMQPE
jgi:hypothetical protein